MPEKSRTQMKNIAFLFLYAFFLIPCTVRAQFKTSSVLAEGSFYKMRIENDGIYKLTGADLSALGINLSTLNPSKIRLFGNQNGMVEQANSSPRADDFEQIPFFISNNTTFSSTDFLLFYAQNAHKKYWDTENETFVFQTNLYEDFNYYFLQINAAENGLRLSAVSQVGTPTLTITQTEQARYLEDDLTNLIRQGRQWLGDRFSSITPERNYTFPITGIVSGSQIKIELSAAHNATQPGTFELFQGATSLGNMTISPISGGTYDNQAFQNTKQFTLTSSSLENLELRLKYSTAASSGAGFLDYLKITYKRNLQIAAQSLIFTSFASVGQPLVAYQVANADANTQVWEITNPLFPKLRMGTLSGSTLTVLADGDSLRSFVAIKGTNFPTPSQILPVLNQNLHQAPLANLLIITHPNWRTEAERLASFKRAFQGLSVTVIEPWEIYQEYASGRQDVSAIRDFVRHMYLRGTGTQDALQYVLLFGDASFDYRNRLSAGAFTNFVPTYQARDSFHPIRSFCSDDFFALLDAHEGFWQENVSGLENLDIGVGRLPSMTYENAKAIVDKIIHYSSSPQTLGPWRKELLFVADDGDINIHQNHAEGFANYVMENYPNFDVEKLYVDAYPQVQVSPTQRHSLVVRDLLRRKVHAGCLLVNFSGHGAEVAWTSEQILSSNETNTWTNLDNLPFFITATCEFGRFDNPFLWSGAEMMVNNPQGGAIGLLTTTRPVFANANKQIVDQLYQYIFEPLPSGQMPCLGDVLRLTKNADGNNHQNRNFTLLSNPSLRLAYPENQIQITAFNGQEMPVSDTIQALSLITLSGQIERDGLLLNDFDGQLHAQMFDKTATYRTLGDEADSPPMDFDQMNKVIYRGTATVSNGTFDLRFFVPKDINYLIDYGKLSLYAFDPSGQKVDAGGFEHFLVGGTSPTVPTDNQAPTLSLYMNDTTFRSGGIVGTDALFLAHVADDYGLNLIDNGIGRAMTATLDGKESFVLNPYAAYKKDSYQELLIEFPFRELTPGAHTLDCIVWDAHNAYTEKRLTFFVGQGQDLQTNGLTVYPNPMQDHVNFAFNHNKAGHHLVFELVISDALGRICGKMSAETPKASARIDGIRWDRNTQFDPNAGFYIYQLNIRSLTDGSESSLQGKLLLTN